MSGAIPVGNASAPSIDNLVADVIGTRTRFRSIEVTLDGTRRSSSTRAGAASNTPSEPSPAALYARIFGPEFKDPNASDFTPDPTAMARKSVLSAGHRRALRASLNTVGASRSRAARTNISPRCGSVEQQLDLELVAAYRRCPPACARMSRRRKASARWRTKPATMPPGCSAPCSPMRWPAARPACSTCWWPTARALLRRAGSNETWHGAGLTRNLSTRKLRLPAQRHLVHRMGQHSPSPSSSANWTRSRKARAVVFSDRMVILWQTDHGIARSHTMDNLPIMTFGTAGGRLRTGLHISAPGDPSTRVGLTVQQALGVPVNSWGRLPTPRPRPSPRSWREGHGNARKNMRRSRRGFRRRHTPTPRRWVTSRRRQGSPSSRFWESPRATRELGKQTATLPCP